MSLNLNPFSGLKNKKTPGRNLGKPIQDCHKWVGEGGQGSTPKQKRTKNQRTKQKNPEKSKKSRQNPNHKDKER
jgi:hypothetical protein